MNEKAPIDGFGIGVNLAASVDVPALDCAYKLQEYAGKPKRKLSEGKATWPGRKQVWRAYDADGRMRGDILSLESDKQPGEALVVPVMRAGKRIAPSPTLAQIRERAAADLKRLAGPLARLESGFDYPVNVAEALSALAKQIDAKAREILGADFFIARDLIRKRFPFSGYAPSPLYSTHAALAIDLVTGIGDHHRVFELDEAAARMQQRGFHRHDFTGFQWNVGVACRVTHRPAVGKPRRFVTDQAHTVGEEFHVIVVLRLRAQRFAGVIDDPPHRAGADRLHGRALDAFDLGEQIFKLRVGFALDRHAANIADIAVIVAARSRST